MWRRLEIEDQTALSGYAGTHRVTLPRTRTIGAIELIVNGVNAATSNSADAAEQKDIRASITNLKVKSGSKTFYETRGIENASYMTYETGRLPWRIRTQGAAATQSQLFTMPFWIEPMARLADGSGMGLPAPLLNSLDLEIEYAFDQTSATIGFASSGHTIDAAVWLYDFEESVDQLNAKQFRTITKKHDYTSVASGDETFGITLDAMRMLRRIYVNAYLVSTAEAGIISDVFVKRDNDETFGGKWDGIQAANASHCKLNYLEHIHTFAESTTDIIYTRVPNVRHVSYNSFGATNRDDTEHVNTLAAGVYTMTNTDAAPGELVFAANEVPTLAVLDWDIQKDLGDMLSQRATSLELILTNAAATGEVKVAEESISRMW